MRSTKWLAIFVLWSTASVAADPDCSKGAECISAWRKDVITIFDQPGGRPERVNRSDLPPPPTPILKKTESLVGFQYHNGIHYVSTMYVDTTIAVESADPSDKSCKSRIGTGMASCPSK